MSGAASGANVHDADARVFALLCYGLYFAAVVMVVPAAIVGVVLAYIKRTELRGTTWESHFTNLIHVFWTSVIAFAIWLAVLMTGIFGIWSGVQNDNVQWLASAFPAAWLLALLFLVWYVYRTIKGFLRAIDRQPYA